MAYISVALMLAVLSDGCVHLPTERRRYLKGAGTKTALAEGAALWLCVRRAAATRKPVMIFR